MKNDNMAGQDDFVQYDDKKHWARLIYIAKKHLDLWTHQHIKPGHGELKLSYMPLIFNISQQGNTNTEISKRALIAKQAMSRTVKELEEKGMITSEPAKKDKRSYTIHLTQDGEKFVTDANLNMLNLIEEYKKLVGEKDFNTTTEVLSKIINYHEKLNEEKTGLDE
jgi:DNA-binding MarR family transcriptional regulator